jgi:hypothetical protein
MMVNEGGEFFDGVNGINGILKQEEVKAGIGEGINRIEKKSWGGFLWPSATRTTSCPGYPSEVTALRGRR